MENVKNSKTVRTTCPLCNYHLLDVKVQNNKVIDVKTSPTPGNKGDAVCAKAVHGLKWHYQDARMAYPMVRQGKGGPWARVSWDEALDIVAGELKRVRTVYGSQATANIIGGGSIMGGLLAMYAAGNFARQYGCFCHTHGETCYIVRVIAHMFTFGCLLNADLDPASESGSVWFWGSNPSACCPPMVPRIRKKKRDGAKVVVIDPVRIPVAKDADLHLQPRPGTDLALALAMMNVIVDQGLFDQEFVMNHTVGFEDLKRHIARYRPEFMEDVVGIPASDIKRAAEMFAKHQPASLIQNIGIDGNAHSFQCLRAIAILHALMGNVDRQGGMLQVFPWTGFVASSAFTYLEGVPCAGDNTLYPRSVNQGSTARFTEPLLDGRPCSYKALMIAGYNPLRQHADVNQVRKALGKAEFICQIDVQFNETTEYADVFLPARVGLEKQELGTLWGTLDLDLLSTLEPCIEAPGEALDDWEIWWRLTDKFGFSRPWKTYEEAADDILKVAGLTLEKLRKDGEWYPYPSNGPFEKWKSHAFNTPSGKVELYSKALEGLGYDPIPTWREPPETPKSDPSTAKVYPLTAIDRRSPHYMHSRLFDCPALRKLEPEPLALINEKDAKKYGISDNDMIVIESLRGSIEMRAKFDDIMEGVISLSMGFPEACSNYLTATGAPLYDPVVGGDRLRGYLVRIRRKE